LTYEEGQYDAFDADSASIGRNETNVSYGIGCDAHDLYGPFASCSIDEPEKWCSDEWCYVHPDCTLASKSSSYRIGRFYSYSQCGYLDRFTSEYVEGRTFQGQLLNVVVMTNSGGWKGSYCTGEDGESSCSGPTWSLVNDVIQRSGAIQNLTMTFFGGPLANYPQAYAQQVMDQVTRDQQTSAFTACAYATGMGYVDVCIGAFTAKPSRDLLSLNIDLWSEPVYLISPKAETKNDFFQNLTRAFSPFDSSVWLCVAAFLFVASMLVMLQERSVHSEQFKRFSLPQAAIEASYIGAMGFFSGAQGFTPHSLGGRMTSLAMGFVILLTISAYTANLATVLIVEQKASAAVASIEVILRNKFKICTQDNAYLVSNLNFPESQTVLIDGRREVLDAIGHQCEAGIMALEDFESGLTDSSLCHLIRVGDPLWYEQQMSPVSDRFKRSATFHLRDAKTSGTWQSALKVHQPIDACAAAAEEAEAEKETQGLALKDMAGPLILAVAFCLLGIVADVLKWFFLYRTGRKVVKTDGDSNGSQHVAKTLVVPKRDQEMNMNVQTVNHTVHTVDIHPDPDRKVEFTPSAQEAKEALDEIEKILFTLKHRSAISSKVSDASETCSASL